MIKPRPIQQSNRVASIDLARGVATLGTFFVSAVAYGLPHAAFFNLKSPGTNSPVDWVAAVVAEIFFDQKAVALLGLLYGISIIRWTERLTDSKTKARGPGLRRVVVLFALGVPLGMHGLLWEGTTLWFFALFTPALFFLRKRRTRSLVILGVLGVTLSALIAVDSQSLYNDGGTDLGQYWVTGAHTLGDEAGSFMFLGTITLLTATMTLGLAIGKLRIFEVSTRTNRRLLAYGFGLGLPLAVLSVAWRIARDFEPNVAMIAEAPNTLGAVPTAIGYIGLINWWSRSNHLAGLAARVRAVGQMALSNSVIQTAVGLFVLRDYGFGRGYFSRTGLVAVVVVVWLAQLVVSKPWLDRFAYGPFEWCLRCVTYVRPLPFVQNEPRTHHNQHQQRDGIHATAEAHSRATRRASCTKPVCRRMGTT